MATKKRKILIADDEASMRTTLSDILSDNGFDVSTAEDGLSAVEMCHQGDYDFVLMDVRMPGIDGVEAFRRIRNTLADISVILMSAYGEDDIKHQALQDGAIAFLDKPLNLDTVIQLLADSSGLSVLAITQDGMFSDVLRSCLEASSKQLTVVGSADKALELVQQVDFDVVMIDAELSETSGLDCYLDIRKINATITAIMVSTADRDLRALADEAVRRTAYTVITKPLHQETLADVVAQLRAQRVSGSIRKPDSHES